MRTRHYAPLPYLDAMPAGNAAAWEPFTFTLKEAMEYFWRLLSITMTCEFTATHAGDTRTQPTSGNMARRSDHFSANIPAGNEHALIGPPGTDAAVWRRADSFTDIWGALDEVQFVCSARMFTPGDTGSRGTWLPASPLVMKPACKFGFTATVVEIGSGLVQPTLEVSTIDPGAGTFTGSFTCTVFGVSLPFYWRGEPGDYPFTWDSVNITAITKAGWYPYAQAGGSNPVWNTATGAQILDPRTASVP